jgi:hypothetical protein
MEWNGVKGEWEQAKGKIREKWVKLTGSHLDAIAAMNPAFAGVAGVDRGFFVAVLAGSVAWLLLVGCLAYVIL